MVYTYIMKTRRINTKLELEVISETNPNIPVVTVQIDCCIYPEEKQVRYYRDGSGYPGSPAFVEFNSLWVTDYDNGYGVVNRTLSNDKWFDILDAYVAMFEDHFATQILERECDE